MKKTLDMVKRSLLVSVLTTMTLVGLQLSASITHAASISSQNCRLTWKQVGGDSFWFQGNYVGSISALSATDAWAVAGSYGAGDLNKPHSPGGSSPSSSPSSRPKDDEPTSALMHWDGNYFSIVNTPDPDDDAFLYGVAAISTNDVWGVGDDLENDSSAFIVHWDGTQVSIISSPNVGGAVLNSVAAVSSTDVWAVGSDSTGTLIEQWDGTSWSVVSSPGTGPLKSVAVVSANDIWAVGVNNGAGLIEHWDGTSWSVVANPSPEGLSGVTAIASNNVWAVGGPTILHWDGTSWSIVPGVNPKDNPPTIFQVASHSKKDVMTGGSVFLKNGYARPWNEQWNGRKWSVSYKMMPPTGDSLSLNVVAAIPNSNEYFSAGVIAELEEGEDQTFFLIYSC
jgi:hypothetical protein